MPHHNPSNFSIRGGNLQSSEGLTVRMPEETHTLQVIGGATVTIYPDGSMNVGGQGLVFQVTYNGDADRFDMHIEQIASLSLAPEVVLTTQQAPV